MNKLFIYIKFISIFLIIELSINFIISLLNLLGLNNGITQIILLVSNIIVFFILNFINASISKKKGYLEGIILGTIFIFFMIMLKIILFGNNFSITSILYYIILLIISLFGGMLGVNYKKNDK